MITNRCLERDEMEQYLKGWSDDAASSDVERHLSECPECERTIGGLESGTRIELPVAAGQVGMESGNAEPDDNLQATIESIRNWNGHPPDEAKELGHSSRQPAKTVSGNFGNYELFELVGRGGMAEVYRARHKRLQRDVALKLIRVPRWHMAESLNRIEREIRAVGKLKHPSIVNAVDAGEHDGVQFLVTEFIEGMDVGRIARAIGPMQVADACEIVRVAALGLDHAHANGIVHRDIKPSNLMLDKAGGVKILDFGLVHLDGWTGVSAEVTSVGQLLGTLDYMAPEQADRADNVNHRSDVYSLGATLFRLLCGRAPYAASSNQSPLEKLRLLANERPPGVATLRPDLPAGLARLIDRTLDRDPANRPASAAHLAESLQPYCEGAGLAVLAARAEALAGSDPDILQEFSGSAMPSIASLALKPEVEIPSVKEAATSSSRFRIAMAYLIGLAMFSAVAFGGIVLVLETQKGQVTIETDIPDLHVELVADGKVRKEIELVPGENVTRIYAGEYEIRISHGTDRYVIDGNSFVLKRGEKVVAKITVDESAKKAKVAWNGTGDPVITPPSTAKTDSPQGQQAGTNPSADDRRMVRAYQIRGDVDMYVRVLSTVLANREGSRMEGDASRSQIVIYTDRQTHSEITNLIAELEKSVVDVQPTPAGTFIQTVPTGEFAGARNVLKTYDIDGDVFEAARFVKTIVGEFPGVTVTPFMDNGFNSLVISATQANHELVSVLISKIEELKKQLATAGSSQSPGSTEMTQLEFRLSITEQLLEQLRETEKASASGDRFTGPVFEGKTLDEWLNTLKFDLSREVKTRAGSAVAVLARMDAGSLRSVSQLIVNGVVAGDTTDWVTYVVPKMGLADEELSALSELIPDADPSRLRQILSVSNSVALYSISRRKHDDVNQFLDFLKRAKAEGSLYEDPDDVQFVQQRFVELVDAVKPADSTRRMDLDAEAFHAGLFRFVLDESHLGPDVVMELRSRTNYVPDVSKPIVFEAAARRLETVPLSDGVAARVFNYLKNYQFYGEKEWQERLPGIIDQRLSEVTVFPSLLVEVSFGSNDGRKHEIPGAVDLEPGRNNRSLFVFGSGLKYRPLSYVPENLVLELLLMFDRSADKGVTPDTRNGIRKVFETTSESQAGYMKILKDAEAKTGKQLVLSYDRDGFTFSDVRGIPLEPGDPNLAANQAMALGALIHEVAGGILEKGKQPKE